LAIFEEKKPVEMRTIITILSIIFFVSCHEVKKADIIINNDNKTWNIKLEDHLGTISLLLPKRFDTLLNWTNWSDCGDPCASVEYRFQPKSLPILEESGFIYLGNTDSVDQLTISHPKSVLHLSTNDTFFLRRFSIQPKDYNRIDSFSNKLLMDTILSINGRYYGVIAGEHYDSTKKIITQTLRGTTKIDGNTIDFSFKKKRYYFDTTTDNFIQTSFDVLKTTKILRNKYIQVKIEK
jgi:hypothetical protein